MTTDTGVLSESDVFVERGSNGVQWVALLIASVAFLAYSFLITDSPSPAGVLAGELATLVSLPFALGYLMRKPVVVRADSIEINRRSYDFDTLGLVRLHVVSLRSIIGLPHHRLTVELCDAEKKTIARFTGSHFTRAEAERIKNVIEAKRPGLNVNFRSQ